MTRSGQVSLRDLPKSVTPAPIIYNSHKESNSSRIWNAI